MRAWGIASTSPPLTSQCRGRYKDIKGEWRVAVEVGEEGVLVRHSKWEQTQDYDATAFWKFRWCMALRFDRSMRTMTDASVSVVDFAFGRVTADETKRAVEPRSRTLARPPALASRHTHSATPHPATPIPPAGRGAAPPVARARRRVPACVGGPRTRGHRGRMIHPSGVERCVDTRCGSGCLHRGLSRSSTRLASAQDHAHIAWWGGGGVHLIPSETSRGVVYGQS